MTDHPTDPAALPSLMLGGSLWAIRADALPRVLQTAKLLATSGVRPPAAAAPGEPTAPTAGVAVIPLTGVLTPHGSLLSLLFGGGGGGVQAFRDDLAMAVADPAVTSIVLDVDSPGGSIGLVPEAAADVRAARSVKPVVAVANTQAASGAYWIASQADKLYVSPSGSVGSIGVYYVHEDWSGANAQAGLAVSYVSAGKYKTEGNPDAPLSEDGRAALQADADAIYAMFVADVASGRGIDAEVVSGPSYGEGRVRLAQDALEAGMVDGVETLGAVVGAALVSATAGAAALKLTPTLDGRAVAAALAARGELAQGVAPPGASDDDKPDEPVVTPEERARIAALLLG